MIFRNIISSRIASKIRLDVARAPAARSSPPPNHKLLLYEYEASPWCRLVREHLTILGLDVDIRPCPRQTLFLEGAFSNSSRFRLEAMEYLKRNANNGSEENDLTFPLLVDATNNDQIFVLKESYEILSHLWKTYGETVIPSRTSGTRRPDQRVNNPQIPFIFRFLSLAGPSYLRPFPTCGLLQTPSHYSGDEKSNIVLYQAEGCPESRLVREVLCTLEIPYQSVSSSLSMAAGDHNHTIPILKIGHDTTLRGASDCTEYLWKRFRDTQKPLPTWLNPGPKPNLGQSGSFSVGAYTAFIKGSRALVPPEAME